MLPRVIIHNAASVDGRIDGFSPEIDRFYEVASAWDVDAHLVGSETLFEESDAVYDERDDAVAVEAQRPLDGASETDAPLLAVPDSEGRVRNWEALDEQPYWGEMVALISSATPDEYVEYLGLVGVDYVEAGDDHVDLRDALAELAARYDVETVLTDSGGTLNGVLLRAGLVDEVSVLVHPYLVGGTSPRSFVRGPDPSESAPTASLSLLDVERREDDLLWLRYAVE
ncbi:RibD family protein [Halomarina halobia]|uniref:RibD family protein n=1 Tax=Halomarina halobia TaxID=3033386 RepID=A0ABD6A7J1_9EURY|nr:RibD family protein [Halomarina sp. PSR21]